MARAASGEARRRGPVAPGLAKAGLRPSPQVQASDGSFGVRSNQFGFTITGTSNLVVVVVVEASTNLVNPTWSPLRTITLNGDSFYFTSPVGSRSLPVPGFWRSTQLQAGSRATGRDRWSATSSWWTRHRWLR